MKIQRPTQAKNERKLSDAIMTKRYLDLQRLRDEVRKAELGRGLRCGANGSSAIVRATDDMAATYLESQAP